MKISQILTLAFTLVIIGYNETAEKKVTTGPEKENLRQEQISPVDDPLLS